MPKISPPRHPARERDSRLRHAAMPTVCQRQQAAPSRLRIHLELAAEAKKLGDYGAATCHELDALRALRAQLAEVRP